MIERHVDARGHVLLFTLARIAHVDEQRDTGLEALVRHGGAETLSGGGEIGTRREAAQAILQESDDVIEADASETYGGLELAAGISNDDDRRLAAEDGTGPRGVLAAETDVDAARQVRRREVAGIARVENLSAHIADREHLIERHRVQLAGERFVE